jgi:hypothetical protein
MSDKDMLQAGLAPVPQGYTCIELLAAPSIPESCHERNCSVRTQRQLCMAAIQTRLAHKFSCYRTTTHVSDTANIQTPILHKVLKALYQKSCATFDDYGTFRDIPVSEYLVAAGYSDVPMERSSA